MSFFDGTPSTEPSLLTGFAGNSIERRSEHRTADAVAAALADARARFYLFRADKVLLKGSDPLFTGAEALALDAVRDTAVLLGWANEAPRLAATAPETAAIDEAKITLTDLRSVAVAGAVSPEHLGALAQGRSLANWHARHGFCANCGTPTTIANGGYRRDCPHCKAQHFPRTDPVVIMLAIDGSTGTRTGRCSGGSRSFRRACTRASPDFWSPARRSRTRFGARRWRNPASASGVCAITPASRGRSRPR